VNLEGLPVWDADSDSTVVSGTTVFAADAYIVIGANADLKLNGGLPVDLVYGSMALANGDDEIGLGDPKMPIDYVAYTSKAFPSNSGMAMGLDPAVSMDTKSNDDGANWCDQTSAYGDGDLGTPGAANDACVVVEP
jgi:hypothetical protein